MVRLARMAGYRLGEALAAMEMRTHEFAVLNHLSESSPLSQQELGQALRINPSNLVGLLDLLEADGLLVRVRDPHDRRRHLVTLTPMGRRRLTRAWEAAEAAEADRALAPVRPGARAAESMLERLVGPRLRAGGAVLKKFAVRSPQSADWTPVDRRRLLSLFRPYRRRLASVLVLILFSAALGMVSPFLLRAVLDEAIPQNDTQLLAVLVAGMIAIAIATGALGVAQTLLSNTVGQRVMHDLRAAVYRHLQRLSLAFFTQTRTGEVQSRIANDIGGVQTVVTSTATSIVSNVTTVLAATAAMFLLDWRLAVAALGLLPFFVWLTRRVGEERRRITAVRQDRLADMSSLVEESLSVSGILLGKTMGRAPELAERFEGESAALADLEVRSRMAGRWRMASVQMSFAAMPALIYLFAGLTIAGGGGAITIGTLVAFTTLQTRLFFPVQSLLSVGVDVQSSLALFERVFHYLDLPVDIEERDGAVTLRPDRVSGAVTFEGVGFRYRPDGPRTLQRHRPRGSARNDPRARGRDRVGKDDPCLPAGAAVRRRRGPRGDRRRRRARHDPCVPCHGGGRRLPGDASLPCLDRGQPALREAGGLRRRARGRGARGADP